MKGLLGLLLAAGVAVSAGQAKAENWVLCGDCTGPLQLKQAAIAAHGLTKGSAIYAVANPDLLTFMYYEVTYDPAGGPGGPAVVAQSAATGDSAARSIYGTTKSGTSFVGVLSPSSTVRMSAATASQAAAQVAAAGGAQSATGIAPTDVERQQYEAIVRMSKSQVLIKPDNTYGYFDSYQTAYYDYHAALDAAITTALAINNPAWKVGPLTKLWEALKMFYGKGPVGCVVFANGDAACFQVNPLAPGASNVLDGTAVDSDGDPIDDGATGSLPNGSGVTITPQPNTPTVGQITYLTGTDPNAPRLACTWVNNFPDKCTVVFP